MRRSQGICHLMPLTRRIFHAGNAMEEWSDYRAGLTSIHCRITKWLFELFLEDCRIVGQSHNAVGVLAKASVLKCLPCFRVVIAQVFHPLF